MWRKTERPKTPSAAETMLWFLYGEHIESPTLKRARKIIRSKSSYVSEEKDATDGKPDSTAWSIQDLMTKAESALDALDACRHPKKKHINIYGEDVVLQNNWSDMRLIGPYISSSSESGRWKDEDSFDVFGELPHVAIVGVHLRDNKPKTQYIFTIVRRLDAMPPNWMATGPGYPYYVEFVHVFNTGPATIPWVCTINNDGKVYPPRIAEVRYRTIPSHSRKADARYMGGGSKKTSIPYVDTRVYDALYEAGKVSKEDKYLSSVEAVKWTMDIQSRVDLNVNAKISDKRGVVNISIPMEDAKRLFRGREKVKNQYGHTKRIIHWVKSHQRITGANVKTHWRGLRKFNWKGLNVEISVPGTHNILQHDLTPVIDSGVGWFHRLGIKSTVKHIKNKYTGEDIKLTVFDPKDQCADAYYDETGRNVHRLH